MSTYAASEPCILVEGPRYGDADFYAKWLLARAKAEQLSVEACRDRKFEKKLWALCGCKIVVPHQMATPDFALRQPRRLAYMSRGRSSMAT